MTNDDNNENQLSIVNIAPFHMHTMVTKLQISLRIKPYVVFKWVKQNQTSKNIPMKFLATVTGKIKCI